jgi:hypothetical protein
MNTIAMLAAALVLGVVPIAYGATTTVTVNKIDESGVGAAIGTLLRIRTLAYESLRIFRVCRPAITAFTSMPTPIVVPASRAGLKWQVLRRAVISIL